MLALCLFAGIWWYQGGKVDKRGRFYSQSGGTEVEWVETNIPDAMAMVYEDAETGLTVIWVDVPNQENDGPVGS